MEKSINERLKTAKRRNLVYKRSEGVSTRELQQLNQMKTEGSWIETLTDFQIDDLERILIEDDLVSEIIRIIGQGKEANVYWVRDLDGNSMALKLFRMNTTSHRDIFSKVGDTGKLQVAEELALKEYLNLSYAQEAGVRVPACGIREEFIFTMEFLGDETEPAPLLKNVDLKEMGIDPLTILEEILDQMEVLFNDAKMVHGDFSEHNLVWYQDTVWVIDFLQSERWHPKYDTPERIRKHEAIGILERDVDTILSHFKTKYRSSFYLDDVMETLIHEKIEDWSPKELMSEYYDPDWINPKGGNC